ncbi:putative Ubiquitin family [Monocercomonoides exilis]|uniref:putative Ubiquitin family n=1 Tax=Monocercomonoides exilis TaxID=2049356 RepID=UPI00355A1B27|nr:putative Ubiquitin family [Monocercomonoides exilis]|eukprot:MONOS_16200.1-p1 / transcript=MONOS_16200.1 / gene=MONOS_16200 / organism=Monocercomonoides_exilis_PA203 / gene_product=unspecified product / transcript_product=unspecified product / location=Mono_scaffold01561:955-2605(-) / protein_length=505 / sequence_SO=supercontig / SO=protein_coding / is_pseudo=false
MQVNIKAVTGKIFPLTIEDSATTEDLKQMIQENFSFPIESQTLVFKGQNLENKTPLKDYSIEDDSTLMLFIKNEQMNDEDGEHPKTSESENRVVTSENSLEKQENDPLTIETKDNQQKLGQSEELREESCEEPFPEQLEELCAMGFDRDKSRTALIAALGDMTSAVEYVMSGIPKDLAEMAESQSKRFLSEKGKNKSGKVEAPQKTPQEIEEEERKVDEEQLEKSGILNEFEAEHGKFFDGSVIRQLSHEQKMQLAAMLGEAPLPWQSYDLKKTKENEGKSNRKGNLDVLSEQSSSLSLSTSDESLRHKASSSHSSQPSHESISSHPLLDELRTHPQLLQLRQFLFQHPTSLPLLLEYLSETAAPLVLEITKNPRLFVEIALGLSKEAIEASKKEAESVQQMVERAKTEEKERKEKEERKAMEERKEKEKEHDSNKGSGQGAKGDGKGSSAKTDEMSEKQGLTEEDKSKVQQIVEMVGVSEEQATATFIASGKNLEAAINILLDA